MPYYVQYNTETKFNLSKSYFLDDGEVIIYPVGKNLNSNWGYYIGWLFYSNAKPSKEIVSKKLHDWIIALNFVYPDQLSLKWLLGHPIVDFKGDNKKSNVINDIIRDNIVILIENVCNLSTLPLSYQKRNVNFIDVYKKYSSLDEKDPLKEQIDLFVLCSNNEFLLNPIYDNQNLGISLLFTIIETIIEETLPKSPPLKCDKCRQDIKEGLNTKIRKFVQSSNFRPEDKSLIEKLIIAHASIRHSFFHSAKTSKLTDSISRELREAGKTSFTPEEDIKLTKGRLGGFIFLKGIVQDILLRKLLPYWG